MSRYWQRAAKPFAAIVLVLASPLLAHAAKPVFKPLQSVGPTEVLRPAEGTFEVTPLGSAIWSLPIWIPSGRNGIEPRIAITYRSNGASGLLGVKFDIDGLSSISRCWGTPAQDNYYSTGSTPGLPDKFCFGGQRLIPRPGSSSGEWQPEFDSSVLIRPAGSLGNPSHFVVYFADGRIAKFGSRDTSAGTTAASRIIGKPVLVPVPTNSSLPRAPESLSSFERTLQWNLDRIDDRYGNYMEVDYERTIDPSLPATVEVVPKEIRWTGFMPPVAVGASATAPSRRIRFVYQTSPKRDIRTGFRAGVALKSSRLLQSIQVFAQDGLVSDPNSAGPSGQHVKTERVFREYRFAYLPHSPAFRSMDRLASIEECAFDTATSSQCLHPIQFTWSRAPAVPQFSLGTVAASSGDDFQPINTGSTGGRPNPVGFVYDVYDAVVGDFDGDGRSDVLYRLPAKNADGSIRNVGPDWERPEAQGDWFIRRGEPSGLGQRIPVSGLPSSIGGDWVFTPKAKDIDRDGRDELLVFQVVGSNAYRVYRLDTCTPPTCNFISAGTLFTATPQYLNRLSRNFPMQLGDLDGDGIEDLLSDDAFQVKGGATWRQVSFGAGVKPAGGLLPAGTFATSRTLMVPTGQPGVRTSLRTHMGDDRFLVDVDGNGQLELLTPTYNSSATPATLSAVRVLPGAASDALVTATTLGFEPSGSCFHRSQFFADLNGDGLADSITFDGIKEILGCTGGTRPPVSVAINTGSAFRHPESISLSANRQPPPAIAINNYTARRGDKFIIFWDPRLFDQGIRIGDLDGDGRADFFLLSGGGSVIWLRSTGTGFEEKELNVPQAKWRFLSGDIYESDNGSYGPRLAQVGDFNGDGLLDFVMPGSSNLEVYLQAGHLPDLVTTISGGPLTPDRTITYEFAGSASTRYTKGQCSWPQLCLKSLGWVVATSSLETLEFDKPNPVLTTTEFRYQDARADVVGRGVLGVKMFMTVVRDNQVPTQVFSTTTAEFDLESRSCHDISRNVCAYSNVGPPVLRMSKVPISAQRDHYTEVRRHASIVPLPGSFGYRNTTVINTSKQWEQSVSGGAALASLGAARTTRSFDEFGNVILNRTEISPEPLSMNGPTAANQIVYTTTQLASRPQTALVDQWLISRYPQYQFISRDPTLPAAEQQMTRTVDVTYESDSVEIASTTAEPHPATPESDTVSGFTLVTTLARDERGVVTSVTRTGSNAQRTTSVTFDPNDQDRIFPVTVTNALNQTATIYSHSALGVPAAVDDLNGVRTEYDYDSFGRLRAIRPTGGSISELRYYTFPGARGTLDHRRSWAMCESSIASGQRCDVFDATGRMIKTIGGGFAIDVRRSFVYDRFARLRKESLPFDASAGGPPIFVEYDRDGLGRVTAVRRPGETRQSPAYTSTTQYDGLRTTETDERGIITTSEIDIKGRIIRRSVEEPSTLASAGFSHARQVSTTYKYWHYDLPRLIEHPTLPASQAMSPPPSVQLATAMSYDQLGRLESLSDPDAGLVTKRYNAFGELKRVEDANGGVTTYEYDDLGRIKSIATPATGAYPSPAANGWAQRTQLVYDSAPNGVGRIARVESNDGIANMLEYDQYGRPMRSIWTVPTFSDAFVFSFDYNALGQLEYVNYPSTGGLHFRVGYTYGDNGHIRRITDASDPSRISLIWEQVARDAAGNSTEEQFGVTERITRRYDSSFQLRYVWGEPISGGAMFQQLSYQWTADGLLKSRTDLNPAMPMMESFDYDFLARLAKWQVRQNCCTTEWTYRFDDWANLRSREVTHSSASSTLTSTTTFEYTNSSNALQPHAPKAVASTGSVPDRFTYDAAGQLLSGGGNTYTWSPFGLPWRIRNRAGLEQSFLHDGLGRRVFSEQRDAAGRQLRTKVSLGGLFELHSDARKAGASYRIYNVIATDGIVAQLRRTSNPVTDELRFVHPDHLGSPDAITRQAVDAQGRPVSQLLERAKYEPFGERRFPWAVANPMREEHSEGANIGFAGHEPDDISGLINMGGRLYDPSTTHFISPDPIIMAGDSQGLNGYTYARNAPLVFRDRSGLQLELGFPLRPAQQGSGSGEGGPTSYACWNVTHCGPYADPPTDNKYKSEPQPEYAMPPDPPDLKWLREGPHLSATTPEQASTAFFDKLTSLDLAPIEIATNDPLGMRLSGTYALLYSAKHDFYVPIREWIAPSPFFAVGADGRVRDKTELHNAVASHEDAAVALAQIVLAGFGEIGVPRGASAVPAQAVIVRTTNASLESLFKVATSGTVRWVAGERSLYQAFLSAVGTRSQAVGRAAFNLFRTRFGRRVTLEGPIHHFNFPMKKFPRGAVNAENLYLTRGTNPHVEIHRAMGIPGAPYSGMAFGGGNSTIQSMFNFWLHAP